MALATMQQKRSGRPFIIKVQYTAGFTCTLPLTTGYNYNFIVDWGDGSVNQVIAYNDVNRIHTYSTGTNGGNPWKITMTGILEAFTGGTTGMAAYLVEVSQWGRTGFKNVSVYNCPKLVACYGEFISTQTSYNIMFANDSLLTTVETADWNTSNITNMQQTFYNCPKLVNIDVSKWDVSKVTTFYSMFWGDSSLTTLDTHDWVFSSSSNINFGSVFINCSALESIGDTTNWNTTKITTFASAFNGCKKLPTLNIGNWDMSNVTTTNSMFANCSIINNIDVSEWNVSKITDFNYIFVNCSKLTSLDTSDWSFSTTSNITMEAFVANDVLLTTIGSTTNWNTTKFVNLRQSFYNCPKLESIDVSNWNVSNSTTFWGLFYNCKALTSLDTAGWRFSTVSNVTLESTFQDCSNITTIGDTSSWTMQKVTSLAYTFSGMAKLTGLNASSWNVSAVTTLKYTYNYCLVLSTLDVSSWNVSTVTDLTCTFCDCRALASIDVTNWSTGNVTIMQTTFCRCNLLTTVPVDNWNTAKVTDMQNMFYNNPNLTSLNVSSWNVSKVVSFNQMCWQCVKLTTFNTSSWDTSSVSSCSIMFYNCGLLASSFTDTKWWSRNPAIGTHVQTFYNCTNVPEYASIPANWKTS